MNIEPELDCIHNNILTKAKKLNSLSILIVDDEYNNIECLKLKLKTENHISHIDTATNG